MAVISRNIELPEKLDEALSRMVAGTRWSQDQIIAIAVARLLAQTGSYPIDPISAIKELTELKP